MKITLAGDWHGSTQQALKVIQHAQLHDSPLIIQLGDFGIWKGDTPFLDKIDRALSSTDAVLYFIDGNHEDFSRLYSYPLDPSTGLRPIRDNIFHLPRGYRFTIDSTRFLALGGAYSVDKQWREPYTSWWPQEAVTSEDIATALSPEDPTTDVLLMHDSPYPAPNPITDHPAEQVQGIRMFGYQAIQEATNHRHRLAPVYEAAKPSYLFHGHYHRFWTAHHKMPTYDTMVVALNEGSAPLMEHALILDTEELRKAGESANASTDQA